MAIKYYIKGFCADSFEDSYENGEETRSSSCWDANDLHLTSKPVFDSVEEIQKYILEENCFDVEKNMKYWDRQDCNTDDNPYLGEYWNAVMVDENNCEVNDDEEIYQDWKEGKCNLWACHLHLTVGKVDITDLEMDPEE